MAATIPSEDVPQTRELRHVRWVVAALNDGVHDSTTIESRTRIRTRHVSYALASARALGLAQRQGRTWAVTDAGKALLSTSEGSVGERNAFASAVLASEIVTLLAPGLLGDSAPTKSKIVEAIKRHARLGDGTAIHRAGALLSWREQLRNAQLSLTLGPPKPASLPGSPTASPKKSQKARPAKDDDGLSDAQEIERIRRNVASNQYHQMLRSVTIDGLRGFHECRIDFQFPIVAVVGENGSGKTTVLKASACAYEQAGKTAKSFFPALFFLPTQWDEVTGVSLSYSMKVGNEDRTLHLRKRTERWRGIENRPKRNVFLFDISRTMPIDALIGYAQIAKRSIKYPSQELESTMRNRLSWVMGRTYKGAKFALADKKRVGVLLQDFGQYSKFHQGAGEAASLDMLGALETVPENSLVLIDEVEASLHPKAQRRLLRTLLWLCRTKRLQLIITTHSQFILEELPPESRILLLKGKETRVVYGASPEYCLSTIDDRVHADLTIFVEDSAAQVIVRELLARYDADEGTAILSQVEILPVGASNVVTILESLGKQKLLRYPCMGIVDADCTDAGTTLRLPGDAAPERQVFADLEAVAWPTVADRFGVPAGDMIAHLEDAARIPNHHAWCAAVGTKIKMSRNLVWETLASIWVRHCLTPDSVSQFVERIRDRMAA